MNTGDYLRCIQYASLSQNLSVKFGYSHSDIIKRIFTWKVNALLLLNNYPQVAEELKNKIQEYEYFKSDEYLGNLYGLWTKYYLGTGKIDSALISNQKSFQYNFKMKSNEGCASALNGIGFIYFEYLNQYPRALQYYFKALFYADTKEALSIYTNIGNVYVKRHLFDSAFYYFQKAFDQIMPGMNEFKLLNSRNNEPLDKYAEFVVTLILDKADAYLFQYKSSGGQVQLNQMLLSYKTADLLMDKIKQNQFELQSKLFWRRSIRRLYEHAIETCWLDKNTEQGYYFFEKSRAVLLDDQLRQDRLMQNQEMTQQYLLGKKINKLENELDTIMPHSNHYLAVEAELLGTIKEQDNLLLEIKTKDPLYYAKNQEADSIHIRDLQDILLKDYQAMLEIFHGDSAVYILFLTGPGNRISKLNKQSFDSLSHDFLHSISNRDGLNVNFKQFTEVSRKLYRLIFGDIPLQPGRIIISPDEIYFPFEALITNSGADIHYMLSDYSISYTYSARFLMNSFSDLTGRSVSDFMGFAPVDYASYLKLASLPGSENSLKQIQSRFGRTYIAVNSTASKTNFLSNFANYRIVQIYSHASYNGLSEKPEIFFADSSLALTELLSKERPLARLIVLSACETALGKEYRGEGVFSFSREFAALGIPASVSNLWSVDNESTYRITELFYQFISEGMPTDRALQQAKLNFIKNASKEKNLPFYWAAPILAGKAEIIKSNPGFPAGYTILIIGLSVLFIWTGFKLWNGKKSKS